MKYSPLASDVVMFCSSPGAYLATSVAAVSAAGVDLTLGGALTAFSNSSSDIVCCVVLSLPGGVNDSLYASVPAPVSARF